MQDTLQAIDRPLKDVGAKKIVYQTTHHGLAVELPPELTPGQDLTYQRRNGQQVEWPNPNTILLPEESMVFRRISPSSYGAALPDFFLLETEVTNDMYHRYLKLSGGSPNEGSLPTIVMLRY